MVRSMVAKAENGACAPRPWPTEGTALIAELVAPLVRALARPVVAFPPVELLMALPGTKIEPSAAKLAWYLGSTSSTTRYWFDCP